MAEAFEELLDANADVLREGKKEFALINGKKHEVIAEEVSSSEIAISGGQSESEQFRLTARKKEFSSAPEKGDPVVFRGREIEVVGPVSDVNGITYVITVGDLTAGES